MDHLQTRDQSLSSFFTDTSQNVNNIERAVSTVAGGALLAYGLNHGGWGGALVSALGGAMLFRGATGHCHLYDAIGVNTAAEIPEGTRKSPFKRAALLSGKVHVTKALTINKSAAELYEFWHNFSNLPTFMRHLESVVVIDDKFSHWEAKAPLGETVKWDAEVTSDIENQRIGWKSLDGSDIPNSGVIEFKPTRDRGTEVKVTMTYEAPGGKLGEWIAWMFGEEPHIQIDEDLRRFKSLMETGSIMGTEGQTSGREPWIPKTMKARA